MSESAQASRLRCWCRISNAFPAIGTTVVAAIAVIVAIPASQADGGRSLAASPAHKPVVAQSICDSNLAMGARTQTVLSNRGERPGAKVVFTVKGARPHSMWHYEVSVASTSGTEGDEVGSSASIRADRNGRWSVTMVNTLEGRYSAKSRIASRSGHEHCSLGVTAAP